MIRISILLHPYCLTCLFLAIIINPMTITIAPEMSIIKSKTIAGALWAGCCQVVPTAHTPRVVNVLTADIWKIMGLNAPCHFEAKVDFCPPMYQQEGNGPLDLRQQGLWKIGMWCSMIAITPVTSKFNSVTFITYVPMSLWLLNPSMSQMQQEGSRMWSIDLRGFVAGKNIGAILNIRLKFVQEAW